MFVSILARRGRLPSCARKKSWTSTTAPKQFLEVGGVPVDVRQASPEKALELEDPQRYATGLRLAPDLGSVPHFPDERTLAGTRPAAAASAHAQLAAIAKPELSYGGPPGVTLEPVEAQATITLSASPDTGWPTLTRLP